jgi:hypothetical protein
LHVRGTTEPLVVILNVPGAGDLAIGVGRPTAVVSHTPESGLPPYSASVGRAQDQEPLVFMLDGHWTEFPASDAIPVNTALEVMGAFLETGTISDLIDWHEI